MRSAKYDTFEHFGVGVPDDPTESDVKRILDLMLPCFRPRLIQTNEEECRRLKGTPGEPVPVVTHVLESGVRFIDNSLENVAIITSIQQPKPSADPLVFKIVKNRDNRADGHPELFFRNASIRFGSKDT